MKASFPRRKFLQRVLPAATLAMVGRDSVEPFASAAEKPSLQPYASDLPRTQGQPPQFKTKLRITKLETFLVKPRWLFLKVHTDEGIVGLGELILERSAKTR